jgi:hypothetical protein
MQTINSHHLPTSTQAIFSGTFININTNNYFPTFINIQKIKHQYKQLILVISQHQRKQLFFSHNLPTYLI